METEQRCPTQKVSQFLPRGLHYLYYVVLLVSFEGYTLFREQSSRLQLHVIIFFTLKMEFLGRLSLVVGILLTVCPSGYQTLTFQHVCIINPNECSNLFVTLDWIVDGRQWLGLRLQC